MKRVFGLMIAILWPALAGHSQTVGGTVVAWGNDSSGQTNVPSGLTNVVSVAAGDLFQMALTSNGTVVVWGDNSFGQTNVPGILTNVTAIAAGQDFALALTAKGIVV